MRIFLCGAGQVGENLAKALSPYYEIILIDKDGGMLSSIQETCDIQVIKGNASDPGVLQKAQLGSEDFVVAVTENDDVNLMICMIAKKFFHASFTAARMRCGSFFEPEWQQELKKNLQLDAILSPERDAAQGILESLRVPSAFDSKLIAKDSLQLLGIQIHKDCPFIGKTIGDIKKNFASYPVKILRLIGPYTTTFPQDEDEVLKNYALYLVVEKEYTTDVMKHFGYSDGSSKKILFFGTSLISQYVLEQLYKEGGHKIIVIEEEKKNIENIAPLFPQVLFLHGSPLNPELLKEAGIQDISYALALTLDDTVNVLSSLMAYSYGVKHPVTLLQRGGYLSSLFALGIEKMIHPSQLVIAYLVHSMSKNFMRTFYPLEGEQTGIFLELFVHSKARVVGMEHHAVESETIHIIAIIREEKIIWQPKNFLAEDIVLMIIFTDGYEKMMSLFKP